MAELAKKLHLKKGTTEHLAKAYSTTAEAGTEYITNKIDGVTAYIPIGATNDSRATVGRVKKAGSAEKAILTMGKPPYTEKSWTTPGMYTFTVPQGVTRVRVAVCGGGGAGAYAPSDTYNGSNGNPSSFNNSLIAYGGNGATAKKEHHSNDHSGYNTWSYCDGSGGTPNGKTGANNGFSLSFDNTAGTYGMGGQSYGRSRFPPGSDWKNSYGGSGGFNIGYFDAKGGETYSLTVGAGAPANNSATGGTSGFVLIAYGGDI